MSKCEPALKVILYVAEKPSKYRDWGPLRKVENKHIAQETLQWVDATSGAHQLVIFIVSTEKQLGTHTLYAASCVLAK